MERRCVYCGKPLLKTGECSCWNREEMEKPPVYEEEYEEEYEEAYEEEYEEPVAPVVVPERKRVTVKYRTPTPAPTVKKTPPRPEAGRGERMPSRRGVLQFLSLYFKDFWVAGGDLARRGDGVYGIAFMVLSVLITALSTLIYGMLHLEEFMTRWLMTGIVVPVLTCGISFGFVGLVVGRGRATSTLSSVANTAGVSAIFPSTIQLAAVLLTIGDKSGKVFQFFALLIYMTWMLSLVLSIFSAHRIKVGLMTLVLMVLFAFLTLVLLRSVWVWFLTGHFRAALYLPTSLYPPELYEAFFS